MAYSLLPTCLHACAVGTHLQTRRRREFPRPAVSMAVLLQDVGSKQNIAAVVRTDRPRSLIIMQMELVSGPAGSWLKPQSSHCNPKMHGAVLWRSWLIMPISR
jgi:hypothetical protein